MSETKWTPPPWYASKMVTGPDMAIYKKRRGGEVARVWEQERYHGTEDETKANANLIAAAPELYAACEWALEHVTDALLYPDDDELVVALRDALAKARGETTDE